MHHYFCTKINYICFILLYYFSDPICVPPVYFKHEIVPWPNKSGKRRHSSIQKRARWSNWEHYKLMQKCGTKVPYTLGWPYTEGTRLYCNYFILCVSCTVVVLTCFVICEFCNVWVFWQLCGCFGNMCTCIYYVFVLFRLCIFILIC